MSCTDSLYTWDAVLGTSPTHSSHSCWCAYSDSINQGPATFLVIARDFRFALLPLCLRKTLVVCLCKGSFILSSQWHVRDTTWSSRDKFQISFLSSKSVLSFSRITRDCSKTIAYPKWMEKGRAVISKKLALQNQCGCMHHCKYAQLNYMTIISSSSQSSRFSDKLEAPFCVITLLFTFNLSENLLDWLELVASVMVIGTKSVLNFPDLTDWSHSPSLGQV